jgi:hypothetical protein
VLFDAKWIERHASSNISYEAFATIVDELEDSGKIKLTQSRELIKNFNILRERSKAEEQKLSQKYDEKWVEK